MSIEYTFGLFIVLPTNGRTYKLTAGWWWLLCIVLYKNLFCCLVIEHEISLRLNQHSHICVWQRYINRAMYVFKFLFAVCVYLQSWSYECYKAFHLTPANSVSTFLSVCCPFSEHVCTIPSLFLCNVLFNVAIFSLIQNLIILVGVAKRSGPAQDYLQFSQQLLGISREISSLYFFILVPILWSFTEMF